MTKNKWKRILPMIVLILGICSNVKADTVTERIWGNDRYETAIEVSKNGWKDGSEYVVLANGENFPDALSSAPLAKKYNAPVLLNYGNSLDDKVKAELERLGTKKVIIIGGLGVVPNTVKSQIEKLNISTERLAGQDRYETAVKVAEKVDFKGELFLVNGEYFPDAVSVSAVAAQKSAPILLTPQNELPSSVANYIKGKNVSSSYVIGEEDVVSKKASQKLPKEERIKGDTKYDTNIAVLNRFRDTIAHNSIYIASGKKFPDALAGSALAAKNSSAIILLDEVSGKATKDYIAKEMESVSKVNVLGGIGSVTNELLDKTISVSNKISEEEKDIDKTIINWGHFVEDGSWVYYGSRDTALTKSKSDGSEKVLLSKNTPSNIKLKGNWIYFYTNDGIYKITTGGKEEAKIKSIDNKDNIEDMEVVGDNICFLLGASSDNSKKYISIDLNGGNERVLSECHSYMEQNISCDKSVSNEYVYFIEDGQLNGYNLKTNTKTKLSDKKVSKVYAYKGYVFFIVVPEDGADKKINKLYRMKADGTEETYISDLTTYGMMGPETFTISNDWLYYCDYNGVIYKSKFNDNQKIKLREVGVSSWLQVRNDYVYFLTLIDKDEFICNPYKMSLDGKSLIDLKKLKN